jgi:hypothetical protein
MIAPVTPHKVGQRVMLADRRGEMVGTVRAVATTEDEFPSGYILLEYVYDIETIEGEWLYRVPHSDIDPEEDNGWGDE